jgi:hypothetical protein
MPARAQGTATMTANQYTATLAKLNLTPYSAASLLGISIRQSHRYASGEQPVKETVAILLRLMLATSEH